MQRYFVGVCLTLVVGLSLVCPSAVRAEFKAEHRKELAEVKKELGKVQGLITGKKTDEAEKILADAETRLKKVCVDAGIMEDDRAVLGTFKLIEQKRLALAKRGGAAAGAAGGVTFEKDVAPVLVAKCLGCHGTDNPRSGLQMDTFAGLAAGGSNGVPVTPGNAANSLLVRKITMTVRGKMPPTGEPLTADQIKSITAWINGGAKFAGDNSTPLAQLSAAGKPNAPVEIAKPTGKETVSFSEDIAPWFSNICLGCHNGPNARGGFSMATFEALMRGGPGGRVILPGNLKDSKLWQMIDMGEMPRGQALLQRKNYDDLKLWIEEGAKFDGPDAKASIRTLGTTPEQKRAKELAMLTPEEWSKQRNDTTAALWSGFTQEPMNKVETPQLLVVGSAAEDRLKAIGEWGEENVKLLVKMFGVKEEPVWKGKLTVFVFKDRFGYDEFTRTHEMRDVPKETNGHSRVNANMDQCHICLFDIGDTPTDSAPGIKALVFENLTAALLQRSPNRVPDWMTRGLGLVLAARSDPKNPYFKPLQAEAYTAISVLDAPPQMFNDGAFSEDSLDAVGYSMVSFLLSQGDGRFVQFLGALVTGQDVPTALRAVYNTDQATFANFLTTSLAGAKAGKKSKK